MEAKPEGSVYSIFARSNCQSTYLTKTLEDRQQACRRKYAHVWVWWARLVLLAMPGSVAGLPVCLVFQSFKVL